MVNSILKATAIKQAGLLNAQNKNLREALAELFPDIPIFMNVLTEEELPEDMTYLVIETGSYSKVNDKAKGARETVGVTMWSTNRPDPTLDQLFVIVAGQSAKLDYQSSTNDFIIPPDNKSIINMFTTTFTRGIRVGC